MLNCCATMWFMVSFLSVDIHYLLLVVYTPAVFALTFFFMTQLKHLWCNWWLIRTRQTTVSSGDDTPSILLSNKIGCVHNSRACCLTEPVLLQVGPYFILKSSAARRALSMLRTRRALSVVASNTWNRYTKQRGYLECKLQTNMQTNQNLKTEK